MKFHLKSTAAVLGLALVLHHTHGQDSQDEAGADDVPPQPVDGDLDGPEDDVDEEKLWGSGHFQGDISTTSDEVRVMFGEEDAAAAAAAGELDDDGHDELSTAAATLAPTASVDGDVDGDGDAGGDGDGGRRLRGAISEEEQDEELRQLGATTSELHKRWPGATIYWVWTWTIYNDVTARAAITKAHHYLNTHTKINLVYGKGSGSYVEIDKHGSGCWSKIGRKGGKQAMSIDNGCRSKGIVIHEFLHALGLYHEQSRQDAHHWVDVHYENVLAGKAHNFKSSKDTAYWGFHFYDHKSIMHYGEKAFSKNGLKTIDCKGKACGQRSYMTDTDIKQLNYLYGQAYYWNDGVACTPGGTCKYCKNPATWWWKSWSDFKYRCGSIAKPKCTSAGKWCNTVTKSCNRCCNGYNNHFLPGWGKCK